MRLPGEGEDSPELTPGRRAYVEAALGRAEGFSDGAFLAYLEELGIGIEEVIAVVGEEVMGRSDHPRRREG